MSDPQTPQPKPENSKTTDQQKKQDTSQVSQGPTEVNGTSAAPAVDEYVELDEFIEREIPNDKKIENDQQTALVVANYLDKNPDIAKYYEYLMDWRKHSDASKLSFHAKFRLKT
jgi:hypothetical protein